jgi:hypothetical protein
MAIETTQPTKVQPSSRLMTITEPMFGTFRMEATIVGNKYAAPPKRTRMTIPKPAAASPSI